MQKTRPLSPHLQVYKWQITMFMSILHRGTGIFLSLGTPLLVCWLAAIAAGSDAYEQFRAFANHWFVSLMLLGWAFSLFYHLCNGIRHLFWDAGKGFEMADLYRSGWMVLTGAATLTAITVFLVWSKSGGGA